MPKFTPYICAHINRIHICPHKCRFVKCHKPSIVHKNIILRDHPKQILYVCVFHTLILKTSRSFMAIVSHLLNLTEKALLQ